MLKIYKYVLLDLARNKIILFYTLSLLAVSLSVFSISETTEKAIISLLNLELVVLPLVCSVFAAIYFYNAAEFIELLVTQPLKRKTIFKSVLGGLATMLCFAFVAGVGIPMLLYSLDRTSLLFLLSGVVLTLCFTAFALLGAVFTRDKAKGIGISILLWFYFTLLFDGLMLFLLFRFSDYPMENYLIVLSFLNPVDLVRVMVLLQVDVAAIMGYTGSLFRSFFGSTNGIAVTLFSLALWIWLPVLIALKKFNRKDL